MDRLNEIKHYIFKEYKSFWKRHYWLGKAFFRNLINKYSQIPYLEVFMTTQCNLSCEKCSNLIPQLKNRAHIPADETITSIENIFRLVEYIYRLKLHGGEVFLHPELVKIIDYVSKHKRIVSVRIATNGSITPSESVLKALSGSKIVVQISDYEVSSAKTPKLIERFDEYQIKYVLLKNREWRDMGDFSLRESNRFAECSIKRCTSMLKNDLYVCSRAAMALQEHEISESYHYNFTSLTHTEFRHALSRLYNIPNEACSHCDGDTKYAKQIPAGKQVGK
jgi:organic radical activating enzyme